MIVWVNGNYGVINKLLVIQCSCVHYFKKYSVHCFHGFPFIGNAFVAAVESGRRALLVSTGTQDRTKLLQNLTAVLGQEESH